MHRIIKWIAPVMVASALWLPVAHGQNVPRVNADNSEKEDRVPAFQYVLALGFTMLVLVMLCMPSRKAAHD